MVQNVAEIIEDKVPVKTTNIQTKAKQQENDVVANKTSNNHSKEKQQVTDKEEKKWKNQSIVIVNSKAKAAKPKTLEVLVQEQNLKLKRGGKKTI